MVEPRGEEHFDTRLDAAIREPVGVDEAAVRRLKTAVRELAPRGRGRPSDIRSTHRLWFAAVAALLVLVAFAFLLGRLSMRPAERAGDVAEAGTPSVRAVQFVLVAEEASRVHVVGDFNEWDPTATPMTRSGASGVWSVELRLPPGRHEYSFLVDGRHWVADANAPRSPASEFGAGNSVLLVQAGGP